VQHVDLEALELLGAAEVERTAAGLLPHRLPAWARAQSTEQMLALVESMPAGVRLRVRTEATELELDVDLTVIRVAERGILPAVFDLVVDGELRESVASTEGTCLSLAPDGRLEVAPGETTTLRFSALPGDRAAVVELWLPHAATVTLRAVRVPDGTSLESVGPGSRRWAHYGSSISHCLEAAGPTTTWPGAVALRTGWDLHDLGFGGQCMLDQFAARTIRDLPVDAISIKAGINIVNGDTLRERTFVPALHGFLDTVREGHPTTPVLVVTPIYCPSVEDEPGPTVLQSDGRFGTVPRPAELATGALSLSRVRELVRQVVTARQEAGDEHLHLLDGLRLVGPADVAHLYDGLHPDAAGYLLMADRFHDLACAPGRPLHA
jgi:hypothetical protein